MMSKELDLGSWVNDVVQHLLENYSGAFDSLGGVVSG
ncbi:MAG TPA: choline ABC transporter permease subunit, partial [Pseudomonas sp.]|nr:choline ABC transporter permease subunit [Pseudomonas sp.]